ncbi:toprim domain-containing protein [Spirillospora sp. NPDC048819]|uniref:toprim domain-containing protein n=1 Tax=Spirillospora sp. NPDC048819 TaxID=3155268 RepID=UPI0033F79590
MPDDEQQRRALDVLQGIADHAVARLADGRLRWDAWLVHASRHGRYGFTNTLLIPAQRRSATDVRSYDAWQKAGRQVRRGETGIRIISTRGRPRAVFDIEQTEGAAIEKQTLSLAEGLRRLSLVAAHLGFYVDRGQGWTYLGRPGRRVQVPPELDDTAAASLLAHQLIHALRPGGHLDTAGANSAPCRGVRRVLADSGAYIVLAELGLPVAHLSFPPAQQWAGMDVRTDSPAAIRAVGDQIVRTSRRISRHLRDLIDAPEPGHRLPAAPTQETDSPQAMRSASTAEHVRRPSDDLLSQLRAALADAHRFYLGQLSGSWGARYLASRGFDPTLQERWELGFAPRSRNALLQHLRALGHRDQVLLQAGLVKQRDGGEPFDLFRDRVLFPLRDHDGQIVGFIGRRRDEAQGPKYLNTPETALFRKAERLFGLHEVRPQLAGTARPLLVEGPLDAIAVNATMPETYAAIAPCGTAITSTQVDVIAAHADLATTGLVMALDGDPAGRAGAIRAWRTLHHITARLETAVLSHGRDPAELLSPTRQSTVHKALLSVTPLADLVIDERIQRSGGQLEFIESRVAAAQAAAPLIVELPPDQIARQITRVAARTGMAPAEVTALVASAISPDPPPDSEPPQRATTRQQQPVAPHRPHTTSSKRTHRRTA